MDHRDNHTPRRPQPWRVVIAAIGAVLVATMLVLGWAVHRRAPGIDEDVRHDVAGQRHGALGYLANAVCTVLNPDLPYFVFAALVVGLIWVLVRKRGDLAVLIGKVMAILAACCAEVEVKGIFRRVRPRAHPGYSYPSGHVTAVTAVGVAGVLLTLWLARRWWVSVLAVAALLVVITASARVILAVHYFTDVTGAAIGTSGVGLLVAALLGLIPVHRRSMESYTSHGERGKACVARS